MLRVLGRDTSINVRKVLWALDEIGVAFEREDWGGPFRSTREADYLRLNPNALVPTVLDGELVLWESHAIIRYYAAVHGRDDLLPADPLRRYHADRWMDWQAVDLAGAARGAFLGIVRGSPAYDGKAIAASIEAWTRFMCILDAHLAEAGTAHVGGEDFTLADICVGLAVNRWFQTPMEKPALPAVAAYEERLKARPAYRKYGPQGAP
ncbi:MAG: glutathione S-transferase family protein [Flavobacteriaceae bacterium]